MTRRGLTALVAVLATSGCAGDDESAQETVTVTNATTITLTETTSAATTETTATPPGEWEGPPEPPPADGTLEVDAFNAYAESVDEEWERDLASTARQFLRLDRLEAPNLSFQATSGPEGGGPTNASILLDGLLDDSVRARRYDLTLTKRPDGTWRIDSAFWAQRCQEGRGHQAFTPEPCL